MTVQTDMGVLQFNYGQLKIAYAKVVAERDELLQQLAMMRANVVAAESNAKRLNAQIDREREEARAVLNGLT